MSSVHYEFVSRTQTGYVFSRTCNICKKKVERRGPPPKNEREGGLTQRFAAGVFDGWVGISFHLEPSDGGDPRDVYLDICCDCRPMLFDFWVDRGLDWTKDDSTTVYLDANGVVVEDPNELRGRPMCVWRAEGKAGIRPCRRFRGHDGECSVTPEGSECPVCPLAWFNEINPPTIYSQRALEHHALTEHSVSKDDAGWWIGAPGDGAAWEARAPFPSAHAALTAMAG